MLSQKKLDRLVFARLIDMVNSLSDIVCRGIFACHLDRHGIVQKTFRQFSYLGRKRGRKKKILPFFRKQIHDPLQIRQKTHVQHPVGLIQYKNMRLSQIDISLLDMIKQTSGRRDQDFGTCTQYIRLRRHIYPAENNRHTQAGIFRILSDIFIDLIGQFARRYEYQRPDWMTCRRHARIGMKKQRLQHRQ